GLFFPGVGNRDYMQYQIDNYRPDSWKGYNINRAAKLDSDPLSDMQRWQLDDEAVAYPTYELITKNKEMLKTRPGFFNICVHKGLTQHLSLTRSSGNRPTSRRRPKNGRTLTSSTTNSSTSL